MQIFPSMGRLHEPTLQIWWRSERLGGVSQETTRPVEPMKQSAVTRRASPAMEADAILVRSYFWDCRMSSARSSAVIIVALGVIAIVLPYIFGTFAVMLLGGVMLASGIVTLLFVHAARREGRAVSVFAPWAQMITGAVILIWPDLALWLVAVILGGGLILSGVTGLVSLRDSGIVDQPAFLKFETWSSVVLGVLLIVMGATGSAILLGVVLGVALIGRGLQQWRLSD